MFFLKKKNLIKNIFLKNNFKILIKKNLTNSIYNKIKEKHINFYLIKLNVKKKKYYKKYIKKLLKFKFNEKFKYILFSEIFFKKLLKLKKIFLKKNNEFIFYNFKESNISDFNTNHTIAKKNFTNSEFLLNTKNHPYLTINQCINTGVISKKIFFEKNL